MVARRVAVIELAESKQQELEATIARVVRTQAAHRDSFVVAPGKTIQPTRRALPGRAERADGQAAHVLVAKSGLEMGETLGQGGMGVVRRAKQLVLDRDVAVKSIQPKLASEAATRMLIQEALMLGRIEHPNILPIYDIRYDNGEPRIVLKKIEGIEWTSLMHRPDLIAEELGNQDALEWNLSVFLQVCNAVDFAHSRGIVHRDLKPDNVMIGEFGEVYVMDWGLSLCTEDDGTDRFPLAKDADQLAGTPQYMAPEMLGGAAAQIGPRTDVYLLGAILFEIISGHAPHRGKDMMEMVSSVVTSRPLFAPTCPAELARICRTAMDPDPGWRFESVEALRQALTGFIRHAGSRRLAEQGTQRAKALTDAVAVIDERSKGAQVERIHSLYAESRFAYRQALEIWPENELASDGLRRVTCAMIEFELLQHNPRSAANLITTISKPEAALAARVAEALLEAEKSEARMADLERFSRQHDVKTGSRDRAIGAGVLGLIWTAAPTAMSPALLGSYAIGHNAAVVFVTCVLCALGMIAWFARADLAESGITRRLLAGGAVAMTGQLALETVAFVLKLDTTLVEMLWPLVWFCVSAMLVVAVDRRLLPMTVGCLATLICGALWPDQRFHAMALGNLIASINMFTVWIPLENGAALDDRSAR